MSIKVTAFSSALPYPKTLARFKVYIPGILLSPLRVSATRVPQSVVDVVPLTVAGQSFSLPGKTQFPGKWSCTLYESALMDSGVQIEVIKRLQIKSSELSSPRGVRLIEPLVVLMDEFTGELPIAYWKLKNSFLISVDDFDVDWSKPGQPLVYKLNFQYNSLETWAR